MNPVPFSTFFDRVAAAVNAHHDPAIFEKDYKRAVGQTIFVLISRPLNATAGNKLDDRYREWLGQIKDDYGSTKWPALEKRLWGGEVRNLKKVDGKGKLHQAAALHYRLHADYRFAHYAKQLDDILFENSVDQRIPAKLFSASIEYRDIDPPSKDLSLDEIATEADAQNERRPGKRQRAFTSSADHSEETPHIGIRMYAATIAIGLLLAGVAGAMLLHFGGSSRSDLENDRMATVSPSSEHVEVIDGRAGYADAVVHLARGNRTGYRDVLVSTIPQSNSITAGALSLVYSDNTNVFRNQELADIFAREAINDGLIEAVDSDDPYALYVYSLMLEFEMWEGRVGDDSQDLMSRAFVAGHPRASYQLASIAFWNDDASDDCEGYDFARISRVSGQYDGAVIESRYLEEFRCRNQMVSRDQAAQLAVNVLTPVANAGYDEAQFRLARLYQNNESVENIHRALSLYRDAAMQGHRWAQNNLGCMLMYGIGVPSSVEVDVEAVRWLRAAANAGIAQADYNLGRLYLDGRLEPIEGTNVANAIEHFIKASENGDDNAPRELAWIYGWHADVERTPENDADALRWALVAEDRGSVSALNDLGVLYERGRVVPQSGSDDETAASYFRRAANGGSLWGMTNLGIMFRSGRVLPEDGSDRDLAAVNLFREAKDLGHAGAMVELGWMYARRRGIGSLSDRQQTSVDWDAQAIELYRDAAALGNAEGQRRWAWMYSFQSGIEPDLQRLQTSTELFTSAVEMGSQYALVNLGTLYERQGAGILANDGLDEARGYYRDACHHGIADGCFELGQSLISIRERTPAQFMDGRHYLNIAAHMGITDAAMLLYFYPNRINDERDTDRFETLNWLLLAIQLGRADAAYDLAASVLLSEADLVSSAPYASFTITRQSAIEMLEQAAIDDSLCANYLIGLSYEYGLFHEQSLRRAAAFYEVASSSWIPEASENFRRVTSHHYSIDVGIWNVGWRSSFAPNCEATLIW